MIVTRRIFHVESSSGVLLAELHELFQRQVVLRHRRDLTVAVRYYDGFREYGDDGYRCNESHCEYDDSVKNDLEHGFSVLVGYHQDVCNFHDL